MSAPPPLRAACQTSAQSREQANGRREHAAGMRHQQLCSTLNEYMRAANDSVSHLSQQLAATTFADPDSELDVQHNCYFAAIKKRPHGWVSVRGVAND
jgi:hypothetical protein